MYLGLLRELASRFECDVHAYVLMTNHVHLLVTPRDAAGPSRLMKDLNQRYAQHFNRSHVRTGTLWEGRFRSHVVDSETYLFTCQRYIESNPIRAGMVAAPWQYPWSSHRANAGLEASLVVTPHAAFHALGMTEPERQEHYRALFSHAPSASELEAIRHCIKTGSALGCDSFLKWLEGHSGGRGTVRPRGRPKQSAIIPPGGKRKLTPV